jgi:hypothetical protein
METKYGKINQKYKELRDYENTKYSHVILGILDILGFTAFINEYGQEAPKEIAELLVESLIENEYRFQDLNFKVLSDTIIIYSDDQNIENAIFDIICALDNFHDELLHRGFLSRGAIVSGDNYIKQDIMVSPAFIKAYHIEENICIYPRIIIDDDLVATISKYKEIIANNYIEERRKNGINDEIKLKTDYDNIINIITNIVFEDFDHKYIVYPFFRALYYSENHNNDVENINQEDSLIMEVTMLKDGIQKAYDKAKTEKEIVKGGYIIRIFNDAVNKLKIQSKNQYKIKLY